MKKINETDFANALYNIYKFLIENRDYNKALQTRYYSSIINSQKVHSEKIISLLYGIANTQSQPKIDYLANFFKKIYQNLDLLDTFSGFLSIINSKENYLTNYQGLYNGMLEQKGWGGKTSALFVKTIYHLHNGKYPKDLILWNDAPSILEAKDKFYLPVDAVIISIFREIKFKNWDFNSINNIISENYKGDNIEVWDDLWFWGFITQIGSGKNRKMEWNLNKYWALRESDKNSKMIKEIKNKAEVFLNILDKSKLY